MYRIEALMEATLTQTQITEPKKRTSILGRCI